MGAPHRLKYFEQSLQHIRAHQDIEFWTGEQILDWYREARPAPSAPPERDFLVVHSAKDHDVRPGRPATG